MVDLRLEDIRAEQRRQHEWEQVQFGELLREITAMRDLLAGNQRELALAQSTAERAHFNALNRHLVEMEGRFFKALNLLAQRVEDDRTHLWRNFWRSCFGWLKEILRCR